MVRQNIVTFGHSDKNIAHKKPMVGHIFMTFRNDDKKNAHVTLMI